ncbi:MAG: 3'(2'),5'-bisphosphate nucleotidase CysQ [Gallionella sp.]|nr:3'(2'),5'-bisphosphate nucleotidase CysQ [Gallionella sp.]
MIDLLHLALQAAQAAGKEIMDVYGGSIDFTHKSDGSPLTEADLRAHDAIVKLLQLSGLPILSEEAVVPFERRSSWERFWLVDPLDGTKDFIAHNNEFTVNIALIENGVPVIGVVAAPALKKVWYASIGTGAWEESCGLKREISALAPWPDEPRMFTSCFHDVPASLEFAKLNGVVHRLPAGAASKLARIAASEAEFYPRFAGTSEWDTAASDAILREAGGLLRTIAGTVPIYNKPSLRNSFFVAWRPPLAWENIQLPSDG